VPQSAQPQVPFAPPVRRHVVRRALLTLTSLLVLIGLALAGPAATAAPSPRADASQSQHSAAKNGPEQHSAAKHRKHKKHKHKHKKRHHKKKHHKKRAAQPAEPTAGSDGSDGSGGSDTESRIQRAADVALQQVGDPYRYGGTGPSSFDCSGLMQYSFGKAGIKIPRTAAAQAGRAHHIARSKMKRGDLLYFTDGGRVYHTAMFLRWSNGKVQMLHAPRSGERVRVDTPWTNSWFAGSLR
jgi:cell wall-associated NlpC family hydrolase